MVFSNSGIINKVLCKDAKRSLTIRNAGGKSDISEALSMQFFYEKFHAKNFILEMEVEYWIDYKMVDYICTLNSKRIGVSVTRAMGFPHSENFKYEDAERLLEKKLYGLIIARNCISKKHSFFHSVLHIWCQTVEIAKFLQQAFSNLDFEEYNIDIKTDISLLLTVCNQECIYQNKNIFE